VKKKEKSKKPKVQPMQKLMSSEWKLNTKKKGLALHVADPTSQATILKKKYITQTNAASPTPKNQKWFKKKKIGLLTHHVSLQDREKRHMKLLKTSSLRYFKP
jgi:hypothetical protein